MIDHVDVLTAAVALGAADPEEAARVEKHVQECAICRSELDRMNEIAAHLPLALDPIPVPHGLKGRILSAARDQPQPLPARAPEPQPVSSPVPLRPPTRSRVRFNTMSLLAAAAVVLFAVGLTVGDLVRQSPQSATARYNSLVVNALGAGEQVSVLKPKRAGLQSHMALAVALSGRTSFIVGPTTAPSSGKVYQLWYIKAGHAPVSAGVFRPDTSGAQVVSLPLSAKGYQVAAMTIEFGPRGAPKPTLSTLFVEASIA